jgi:transcriptional regulator with XRE-family HTH domain
MFLMGDNLSFSEWLSDQMDQRGWSQSDLASAAGVGRAAINKIVNQSINRPDPETLLAIARALKMSPVTLFRIAGLLPPEPEVEKWDDFKTVLEQISEKGREELLVIAQVKLEFEKKGRAYVE